MVSVQQFSCPDDITVNNDPGSCGAFVVSDLPVVDDNCNVLEFSNNYNQTSDASDLYPVGTTEINWVVIDESVQFNFCTQTITVIDLEDPQINCEDILTFATDPGSL